MASYTYIVACLFGPALGGGGGSLCTRLPTGDGDTAVRSACPVSWPSEIVSLMTYVPGAPNVASVVCPLLFAKVMDPGPDTLVHSKV